MTIQITALNLFSKQLELSDRHCPETGPVRSYPDTRTAAAISRSPPSGALGAAPLMRRPWRASRRRRATC